MQKYLVWWSVCEYVYVLTLQLSNESFDRPEGFTPFDYFLEPYLISEFFTKTIKTRIIVTFFSLFLSLST